MSNALRSNSFVNPIRIYDPAQGAPPSSLVPTPAKLGLNSEPTIFVALRRPTKLGSGQAPQLSPLRANPQGRHLPADSDLRLKISPRLCR